MNKKLIVISGVNLIDAGPLSVFHDCLDSIVSDKLYENFDFMILVGKKELFEKYVEYFKIIEFPRAKQSWFGRIYYEYFYFKRFSKQYEVFCWLSMHDMTPNVQAKYRAVYCHNATVSFDMKLSEIKYDKKVFLFSKFYRYLYAINIKRNDYVIVQQDWLKQLFQKLYKINNVIVSTPNVELPEIVKTDEKYDNYTFVYIAYPRFFKNFEVICEANRILEKQGIDGYQIILSIDGTENLYSQEIVEKYKDSQNIRFIGLQTREKIFEIYGKSDCMIFPSRLESWGLPITEYQMYEKPMLVTDEPYAHETVGKYDKVKFFEGDSPNNLAENMKQMVSGKAVLFDKTDVNFNYECRSWSELTNKLFVENK